MTTIRLKIEGGKVTFMQQQGTEIPYPQWVLIMATVCNIVERAHGKREGDLSLMLKGMSNYYDCMLVEPKKGFGRSSVKNAYINGYISCLAATQEVYGINYAKLDFYSDIFTMFTAIAGLNRLLDNPLQEQE